MSEMKALSVKQPWAWTIAAGYKNVENRSRRTNFRGGLLIHAGAELDPAGFQFLWEMGLYKALPADLPRGGLVGMVEVVDCVRGYESEWALPGQWHWVLAHPREFRNVLPCPGRLGMFYPEVSERALGQARRHSIGHRKRYS
ncbi:MAG: ASCH domain-containing protein [Actinomycetota bacterium]|nr:ASCH domain-containing protein [Actinomycetota bacterium]